MARSTRATLVALGLAGLIFAVAMVAHSRELSDTEIVAVPLDPTDPSRDRLGQLEYRGGLDIPPMGQNIGGLSGLRWDADSGRLLAITDDARWVWMTPIEEDGQLIGISDFEVGNLRGIDGEPLTGKEQGDSESLTRNYRRGGWTVGFERDHRIWSYRDLTGLPRENSIKIDEELGQLESNAGVEAMAANYRVQLFCAERLARPELANCRRSIDFETATNFAATAPAALAELGAVPTDADALSDGTAIILFRSYSRQDGNGMGLVSYSLTDERRELASLRPPLTVDNFEGLAVREEADGTFLYIVSDDNFSSNQRTLLLKFEVLPEESSPVQ